jgi:transcriptional regulator with XRE-family HTH domain
MGTPVRELIRLCVQAGLTEDKLAALVGVQVKTVRQWEQGKAWPQSLGWLRRWGVPLRGFKPRWISESKHKRRRVKLA